MALLTSRLDGNIMTSPPHCRVDHPNGRVYHLRMAGGPRPGGDAPGGILDLLRLASDRPRDALPKPQPALAAAPPPSQAPVPPQAVGSLPRGYGDLDAAT